MPCDSEWQGKYRKYIFPRPVTVAVQCSARLCSRVSAYSTLDLFSPGAYSGLLIFFENSEEPFDRKTYLLKIKYQDPLEDCEKVLDRKHHIAFSNSAIFCKPL